MEPGHPDWCQLSDERASRIIVVLRWGNDAPREKGLVCGHPHTLDIEQRRSLAQNPPPRRNTIQVSQFTGITRSADAWIRDLPFARTSCDYFDCCSGLFLLLLPSIRNAVMAQSTSRALRSPITCR